MPRKSSKTAQVLRLITKSGEREEPHTAELEVDAVPEEALHEEELLEEAATAEAAEPEEPEREFAPDPVPTVPANPAGSTDMRQELKEQLKEELKEELLEELELGRGQLTESVESDEPVTASKPPEECEPLDMGLHRAPPPVARSHDLDIINLAEVLAYEKMDEVMSKLNVCTCKLCQADVLALTLNYLPQKYVTTDEDKQRMQLDLYRKQYETDLLSALTRACVRVKGSPRHK